MKTFSFLLLMMASMAFVLLGCSDNATQPVSPTDQSVQTPASLEKKTPPTTATFSLNSLKTFVGGGLWYAGGKLHIKKFEVQEPFETAEHLLAGRIQNYLSLTVDLITGEGPVHGSFTIYPDPSVGGVWECTYEGYRYKTNNAYVFALPLKGVGHGKGGTIDKMKLSFTITLNVLTTSDLSVAPPQVPIYWSGTGTATIKQH